MSKPKETAGKTRWDLVPFDALELVAKVLTDGAEKYEDEGWRAQQDGAHLYFAAAMRHLSAWRRGERLDPKSGLPHLAHAACNVLIVLVHDELRHGP